ncbi:MAG: transposase [Pyrinomonadaceae bacterium]
MYLWRKLTPSQREQVLEYRKSRCLPWHRPPHFDFEGEVTFLLTAACYEHKHILGKTSQRMAEFEATILEACAKAGSHNYAWCILPNHYHLVTRTANLGDLRSNIGKVHGRTAYRWNREDNALGRKVWHNYFDRDMRSDRHYWATINYVHNNAVRHGYAEKWQDWPFSSAQRFLEAHGHEETLRIWREFPVSDYGDKWDVY